MIQRLMSLLPEGAWFMPGIRDLKGRPIDEVVSSRNVPETALPDDHEDEIDVDAAVLRTSENQRQARLGGRPIGRAVDPPATVLPDDFESGLKDLERTIASMVDKANGIIADAKLVHEQMAALRARAEKDAAKLAKVDEALKALRD